MKRLLAFVGRVFFVMVLVNLDCSQDLWSREAPVIKDYPVFDVAIYQESGRVRFEFYKDNSSVSIEKKVPHTETFNISVHLRGSDPLWQIVASDQKTGVATVTYGVVPPGFQQIVPKRGPAPALEKNVEYYVSARGGGNGISKFTYQGKNR